MDRADIKLGFLLAYIVAAALHAGLALLIQRRRYRSLEIQIFAGSNWMLALWHMLQLAEYTHVTGMTEWSPGSYRLMLGVQLLVSMLVLVLFFHLMATFEGLHRRAAPSLRAAITNHLHRNQGVYVPLAYVVVLVGALMYVFDAGGISGFLADVRQTIGPTSAYLFGLALMFMTFVLFPARAGQEKILIPALGRALLLINLGLAMGLIALWSDAHPVRMQYALLPWLHLQSVAFCIFLAFVRYEFPFLDDYLENALRLLAWSAVVVAAYFAFNRLEFRGSAWSHYATSMSRIGVLLAAVGLGPWIGATVARWSDRVIFGREVNLERAVISFASRLATSPGLGELVEAAARDVATAMRAKEVRIVVGQRSPEEAMEPGEVRLRIPLGRGSERAGWLLLGERRNLYPYFEGERRYLRIVASLLGAAVIALRKAGATPTNGGSGSTEVVAAATTEQLPPRDSVQKSTGSPPSMRQSGATGLLQAERLNELMELVEEIGDRDPGAAVEIVRRLNLAQEYLDGGIGSVSLEQEMGFVQDVLTLEKLRWRNRLEVDLSYDRSLRDQTVPRAVLLPLLDNAVQHGMERQLKPGRIRVHAQARGDSCEILVEDNGRGLPDGFDLDRCAIDGGLQRVRSALQRIFGEHARLLVASDPDEGTRIGILLPRHVRRGVNGSVV